MKPTLGPWAEDEKHTGGARAIIGDGQQLVALVYGKTPDEQDANAKVIAGAILAREVCELIRCVNWDSPTEHDELLMNDIRRAAAMVCGRAT